MGLFDKIKAAKNALTGGSAKVSVDMPAQCSPGQPVEVVVRVAAEQDLKFDAIYLLIKGIEKAEVEDSDKETIRGEHESYEVRIDIAGGGTLSSGSEQTFAGNFTLPNSVQPSFHGTIVDHVWKIQAGVDAFGNDPDSGWKEFEVR